MMILLFHLQLHKFLQLLQNYITDDDETHVEQSMLSSTNMSAQVNQTHLTQSV